MHVHPFVHYADKGHRNSCFIFRYLLPSIEAVAVSQSALVPHQRAAFLVSKSSATFQVFEGAVKIGIKLLIFAITVPTFGLTVNGIILACYMGRIPTCDGTG